MLETIYAGHLWKRCREIRDAEQKQSYHGNEGTMLRNQYAASYNKDTYGRDAERLGMQSRGEPIMATKANIVDTAVMTRSRATSSFRLQPTHAHTSCHH